VLFTKSKPEDCCHMNRVMHNAEYRRGSTLHQGSSTFRKFPNLIFSGVLSCTVRLEILGNSIFSSLSKPNCRTYSYDNRTNKRGVFDQVQVSLKFVLRGIPKPAFGICYVRLRCWVYDRRIRQLKKRNTSGPIVLNRQMLIAQISFR